MVKIIDLEIISYESERGRERMFERLIKTLYYPIGREEIKFGEEYWSLDEYYNPKLKKYRGSIEDLVLKKTGNFYPTKIYNKDVVEAIGDCKMTIIEKMISSTNFNPNYFLDELREIKKIYLMMHFE